MYWKEIEKQHQQNILNIWRAEKKFRKVGSVQNEIIGPGQVYFPVNKVSVITCYQFNFSR